MKIICEMDASGPLDGKKTIYTVELESGKYIDVMFCAGSGLLYVMESADGGQVYNDAGETVKHEFDEAKIIAFVREERNYNGKVPR